MPVHPKFSGKFITEKEHQVFLSRFGELIEWFVNPVLEGFDLYERGRLHRNPDVPCLYIFRNMKMYEQELRSIFLHIQETKVPNEIEVVFRRQRKFKPLEQEFWDRLTPDRCQPNYDNWKSIHVNNSRSIDEARRLISLAIEAYDKYYEIY